MPRTVKHGSSVSSARRTQSRAHALEDTARSGSAMAVAVMEQPLGGMDYVR